MELLSSYPDNFIHGFFEPLVETDWVDSDILVAFDGKEAIGSIMFNRKNNEYNWLVVKKGTRFSKSEVAKKLFEYFYPSVPVGTPVHFFVNTEDSSFSPTPSFTGKSFEPARRLYRSMGLEMSESNRIENHYGPGAHVYKVEWVPNP